MNTFAFSPEQTACICQVMEISNKLKKLEKFMWTIPNYEVYQQHESVLRAKAHLAYHEQQYKARILHQFYTKTIQIIVRKSLIHQKTFMYSLQN